MKPNTQQKKTVKGKKEQKPLKHGSTTAIGSSSVPLVQSLNRSSYFKVGRSNRLGAVRVKGQDYIGKVSFPGTDSTVVANWLINPRQGPFTGTRLEKYAQLYEKFLFRNLRFHFQSASAATCEGSVIMAYDRDMADQSPFNNEDGIRTMYAWQGTRSANIWESFSIECPLADMQEFYYSNYTGYEGRITAQGQLYLATLIGANPSGAAGMVWVEYDVELFDPQLEQGLVEFYAGNEITSAPVVFTDRGSNSEALPTWYYILSGAAKTVGLSAEAIDTALGCVTVPAGTYIIEQLANVTGVSPGGGTGFINIVAESLKTKQNIAPNLGVRQSVTENGFSASTNSTAFYRATYVFNEAVKLFGVTAAPAFTAAKWYLRILQVPGGKDYF